jgi:D-threonate/D-erythronate kinase
MTGALDSAAAFVPRFGALDVATSPGDAGPLVIDAGTREAAPAKAAERAARFAPALAPAPDRLCFLKVDSLLRGNAGAELAALLRAVAFDRVVIAPAPSGRTRRSPSRWRARSSGWSAPTIP